MQSEPVVVSQTFQASIEKVWAAITDPDQMREWFFETIETFQPAVGFQTEFDVDCEGKIYRHCWRIVEVIPNQRILYGWRYAGVPGDSSVSWDLSDDGSSETKLTLTHAATEPFPADDPNFSKRKLRIGLEVFHSRPTGEFP